MAGSRSFSGRARQAWTIATVELRRVFFAKRALWVYALALLPSVIFFGHGVEMKIRSDRLARRGLTQPALMDSVREGEAVADVKKRLGKPAEERWSVRSKRVRQDAGNAGDDDPRDRAGGRRPLRPPERHPSYLQRGARSPGSTSSRSTGPTAARISRSAVPPPGACPAATDQGPEKAVNGSVAGGEADRWCADDWPAVPAGGSRRGSSGEALRREARQCGRRRRGVRHPRVQHPGEHGRQDLHHGRDVVGRGVRRGTDRVPPRSSTSTGGATPGSCSSTASWSRRDINRLLNFEEDRTIFAGIFQFFYLRLAIFFGCLGMFMYLFRGEMSNRTLHYWFLAPARREVLLAGQVRRRARSPPP